MHEIAHDPGPLSLCRYVHVSRVLDEDRDASAKPVMFQVKMERTQPTREKYGFSRCRHYVDIDTHNEDVWPYIAG